jgi:hypothetical protein
VVITESCYSNQNIEDEVGGGCGACGEKIYEHRILVGNVKKRELGKPRRIWEDVQEILLDSVV